MRTISSILWYNPIIGTGSVGILLPVLIDCCGGSRCIYLKAHDSKHYESHISDKVTEDLFLTCLEAVNITLCAAGEAEALRVALAVVDRQHFSK